MLKANKLFAMAAKLEEEGVITPNTEVEVSASVSVTPEEQEKIDEALTEVEEIATAEQELDESAEEIEDLGEAEATLSAIRDAIKREGIVTPQMYAFLQDAGYLEVIASFQKNVTYPASEAIANVSLNKQYADAIVAGCEAGMKETAKTIWEWIKKMFQKLADFVVRIYNAIRYNSSRVEHTKTILLENKSTIEASMKTDKYILNGIAERLKAFNEEYSQTTALTVTDGKIKDHVSKIDAIFKALGDFNDKLPTLNDIITMLTNALTLIKEVMPFRKKTEAEEKTYELQVSKLKADDAKSEEAMSIKQKAIEFVAVVRKYFGLIWKYISIAMSAGSKLAKSVVSSKKEAEAPTQEIPTLNR